MYTRYTFYPETYIFSDLFAYFWLLFMTMILCSCWLLFFKPWFFRMPKEFEKKKLPLRLFDWRILCFGGGIANSTGFCVRKRNPEWSHRKSLFMSPEMGVVSFGSVLMVLSASHLNHQYYWYWSPKFNLFHSPVPSARKKKPLHFQTN